MSSVFSVISKGLKKLISISYRSFDQVQWVRLTINLNNLYVIKLLLNLTDSSKLAQKLSF